MDKETLRMQMLAGIITESEYAVKLNEETEQSFQDFFEKLEAKLEKFTGEDMEIVSDEKNETVEIDIIRKKNSVMKAIETCLKENPTYIIDPKSKFTFPDGSISFEIKKNPINTNS